MTKDKNRFPAKRKSTTKSMGAGAVQVVLAKAMDALQNENTRKMLVDNGKAIAAEIQQWRSDHKLDTATDTEPSWLSEKFGQGKLERRVEDLAATLASLSAVRPELAEALAPVREAVNQIRTSVEIAGRLPLLKRKQAHLRLDKVIGSFEKKLFEASLPSTQ